MQKRKLIPKFRVHSIPITCILLLLLGLIYGICFVSPKHNDNTYASEDYSISPTALSYTALTIGGDAVDKQVTVAPGGIGYRNHTITIATSQLSNYTLTISGPVGLTSTNGSTITGAGGKTPTNMTNNTWGYAYGQSGNSNAMTYSSFTGSNQTLVSNTNTSSTNTDTTSNLSFAIKFADNAIPTNYKGTVILSLIATPKS